MAMFFDENSLTGILEALPTCDKFDVAAHMTTIGGVDWADMDLHKDVSEPLLAALIALGHITPFDFEEPVMEEAAQEYDEIMLARHLMDI